MTGQRNENYCRFCDIHLTVTLVPATIETLSPLGDRNTINTLRCGLPSCNRNYTHDFGYFDFAMRQRQDFGDLGSKPRRGWNHHVEYMVLTEIDGLLTWACPVHACKTTQPYKVHFQSKCAYTDCGKPTAHTFETTKLKDLLHGKEVKLYCIYCDRTWNPGEAEQTNIARLIETNAVLVG